MRNQKLESTLRAASLLLPAQLLQIGMVRKTFSHCIYFMNNKAQNYAYPFSIYLFQIIGCSTSIFLHWKWQRLWWWRSRIQCVKGKGSNKNRISYEETEQQLCVTTLFWKEKRLGCFIMKLESSLSYSWHISYVFCSKFHE